jgi:hypothetical protein
MPSKVSVTGGSTGSVSKSGSFVNDRNSFGMFDDAIVSTFEMEMRISVALLFDDFQELRR